MAIIQKEESEPDAIKSLLAQVAEGQKRMEENRADSGEEVDQLGQILAGIADGTLAPMRPDEEPKGTSKPSQTKPAKKPETAAGTDKAFKDETNSLSEGQNLGHHDRSGARRRRPGRYRKKTSDKRKRRRAGNCTNFAPGT